MGEIRKLIGENIKRICAMKGIRQVDIAEYMGVSQGSVSNWIKGTNSLDIENLAKLCRFLGVSLDQIYGIAPIEPAATLSTAETEMVSILRSLNPIGQTLLLTTARTFAGNPDMQKGESGAEAM